MLDLNKLIRWSEKRRPDRPKLLIPCIDELGSRYAEELVTRQLVDCAIVIKARGGLYRWAKYTGKTVLVIWEKESRQFIHFDNAGFCQWLGANFDLCDRMGMHFGVPAAATGARIWETLLLDSTNLPFVNWQTVDQWRREGK